MKEKIYNYNVKTGETEIIEVIVEEILDELPIEIRPTIDEKIEEIKEENKTQDMLVDTTMLATDELYTMIEPILETVPQTMSLERSGSKMVDMYVCMIQRGLKTIEQIPARYREEVRRILEELEK